MHGQRRDFGLPLLAFGRSAEDRKLPMEKGQREGPRTRGKAWFVRKRLTVAWETRESLGNSYDIWTPLGAYPLIDGWPPANYNHGNVRPTLASGLASNAIPSNSPHFRGAAVKLRQMVCFIALAGTCLLLSSCGESRNPLCDPLEAKPDSQLAGIWRVSDPNGTGYFHIGRAGGKLPPGIMRTLTVAHSADGTVKLDDPSELLMFPTTIGENHYLNIVGFIGEDQQKGIVQFDKSGWNPSLVNGYCLVKYQVKGDALSIWIMNGNAQSRLIRSGKVTGTIERAFGVVRASSVFTDSTEKLAALLATPESANLFDEEPTLRVERVK